MPKKIPVAPDSNKVIQAVNRLLRDHGLKIVQLPAGGNQRRLNLVPVKPKVRLSAAEKREFWEVLRWRDNLTDAWGDDLAFLLYDFVRKGDFRCGGALNRTRERLLAKKNWDKIVNAYVEETKGV